MASPLTLLFDMVCNNRLEVREDKVNNSQGLTQVRVSKDVPIFRHP